MTHCLVVTPCGSKKAATTSVARNLYKSTRIRAVYARRKNRKMAILSARYGLIGTEALISPYDQMMDDDRAAELLPQVSKFISEDDYSAIIFFRGGTGDAYLNLMKEAASAIMIPLVYFGYPNRDNAHVSLLPEIIDLAERAEFVAIQMICSSAFVYSPGKEMQMF